MKNLVSVIIPCFQQGRFLADAISSLKWQSHENWEAIIVDDGSTDETKVISHALLSGDTRIIYIYKEHGGPSSARNTGLKYAKGDWIQFLDGDDLLECEKFAQQINFLKANINIDIVYGGSKFFTDDAISKLIKNSFADIDASDRFKRYWNAPGSIVNKFVNQNILTVCSPLIRAEKIRSVGLFNEKLNYLEDWEFWIRCAMLGRNFQFVELKNSCACIRVHSQNISKNTEQMIGSQVELRLWLQQILEEIELKKINFSHLMHMVSALSPDDRSKHFKKIYLSSLNNKYRLIVAIAFLFEKGGPLNNLLSIFMTERMQRKVAKWIGRSN